MNMIVACTVWYQTLDVSYEFTVSWNLAEKLVHASTVDAKLSLTA